MSKKNLYITIPHSGFQQPDDPLSLEAASALIENFKDRNVNVLVFQSKEARAKCDLNREVARFRDCGFRDELTEAFNTKNDFPLLLDVHSFPPQTPFSEDIYTLTENSDSFDLAKKLCVYLNNKNFYCLNKQGANNDIIEEANKNGITAILLEFNEKLSDKNLSLLTGYIANFFDFYLTNVKQM